MRRRVICRKSFHHGPLATLHGSTKATYAKFIHSLTWGLVGCLVILLKWGETSSLVGKCQAAVSHLTPNLVGQCHKTTSHPSLSFQLITGLSTSCLPLCRAQLLASVYTKLFGWKLEIAPLGQSDPLPVPPVFWPVQFSVIVYGELGRQGAEVMWIFLSLSK